jgi:deoxyribonuclease V
VTTTWPTTRDEMIACQLELARRAAAAEMWRPEQPGRLRVAAVFCAFATGRPGPGAAGDPAWAAAVLWAANAPGGAAGAPPVPGGEGAQLLPRGSAPRFPGGSGVLAEAVAAGTAGAPYEAGLLGLRAGPLMEAAVRLLEAGMPAPGAPDARLADVLLVDATGLDHPRGAGLALHLGAVLGLPSVGVTDRVLVAEVEDPAAIAGSVAPLLLEGRLVGWALRARARANPVLVHAAWRTDPETALAIVRGLVTTAVRTPEPLRLARHAARVARAWAEGRLAP